jgi:CheY-like chemotaxis protein
LRAELQRHGFEVRAVANGRDAIESYYELSQEFHVAAVTVLLDVQMPGLDGPMVLAALQAMDPDVRAFFMTGDTGGYGKGELLATGARRVFAKPLDFAEVVAELRRSMTVSAMGANSSSGTGTLAKVAWDDCRETVRLGK